VMVFPMRARRRVSRRSGRPQRVGAAVAIALTVLVYRLTQSGGEGVGRGHDVFGIALGCGIFVFGIGLVVAILREANPGTRPKASDARPLPVPPEALHPALAGTLVAGDVQRVHGIACLFELVRRGCLLFELVDADKPHLAAAWQLRRSRGTFELADWERSVLEAVCPQPGDAVVAPVAWRWLRGRGPRIRQRIRAELQRSGDLDAGASERRRGLYAVSFVSALLGLGALAAAGALVQRLGPTVFAPWGALLVVAVVALAAAVNMPRLTRRGGRRAVAWMGFAGFLRGCTRRGVSLEAESFGRDFGYAIAFGLGTAWLRAAKRAGLDAPGWFAGSRAAAAPLAALEAQLVAAGVYEGQRSGHVVHTAG